MTRKQKLNAESAVKKSRSQSNNVTLCVLRIFSAPSALRFCT